MIKIGGIIERDAITYFSVSMIIDKPGAVAELLKIFALGNINLEYITEASSNGCGAVLAFCVDTKNAEAVDLLLKQRDIKIKKMEEAGFIGVYGPHFREKPAIAAKFCDALGDNGINIYGISSSISSIACIIKASDRADARQALLKVFELP